MQVKSATEEGSRMRRPSGIYERLVGANQCPCPRTGGASLELREEAIAGAEPRQKESHGRGKRAGKPHGDRGWECDGRTGIKRPLTPPQEPLFRPDGSRHQHPHPCRPTSALVSTSIGANAEPVLSLLYIFILFSSLLSMGSGGWAASLHRPNPSSRVFDL